MDVHAKADSKAQAILNSVADKQSRSPARDQAPPPGTTLISITTPRVPTIGSLSAPNTNKKASNIKPSRTRPAAKPSPIVQTAIPDDLKILCCTCSQLFNSQPELFSHKCPTTTGQALNGNAVTTKPKQIENSLTATLIPSQDQQTLNEMEDPEKFVLSLAEQLSTIQKAVSGSNQQIVFEIPPTMATVANSVNSVLNANAAPQPTSQKKAFNRQRAKAPSKKQRELTKQAELQQQQEAEQSVATIAEQSDASATGDQAEGQTLLLQQPDGQVVTISIPFGLDVNEVLSSLMSNDGDATIQGAGAENAATVQGEAQQQQSSGGDQAAAIPAAAAETNGTNQVVAMTTRNEDGTESTIFYTLPMNPDGTCAFDPSQLDADTLASWLASGDATVAAAPVQ